MKNNTTTKEFQGFYPETSEFLVQLRFFDSRTWFYEHQKEYTRYVKEPMKKFAVELGQFVYTIDSEVFTDPRRTISRVNRDLRFSRDKHLYRDTIWVSFKRPVECWYDSPVFYFEIQPDVYVYGIGYYSASRETMDKFRQRLIAKPGEFLEIIEPIPGIGAVVPAETTEGSGDAIRFSLVGEDYRKMPKASVDEKLLDWYRKKCFSVVCIRPHDSRLYSRQVLLDVMEGFSKLAPLYRYLWGLKD